MEELLIVVTTCKNYLLRGNIIEKLAKSGLKNVIVVSGQEDNDEIIYLHGIKVIKVRYTGLHHTGVIYIKENYNKYSKYKYFMLLPDTVKFGEKFKENIEHCSKLYLKNNLQVLGFINPYVRPSMDMGILHIEHINNTSEYLCKIKTFDLSKENLLRLKRLLIYDENCILGTEYTSARRGGSNYIKIVKNKIFLCNNKHEIMETRIEDNTINQVYIPLLDFYKYQRNFRGPNVLRLDY
jgi:hypothetical protein